MTSVELVEVTIALTGDELLFLAQTLLSEARSFDQLEVQCYMLARRDDGDRFKRNAERCRVIARAVLIAGGLGE